MLAGSMSSSPVVTRDFAAIMASRRRNLRADCTRIHAGTSAHVLEIGSGHGHFLTAYAQQHPDRLCVGIDLLGDRIERAIRKQVRARLTNLHFVQAEVSLYLECLPDGVELKDIFVLFPDPWPKLRHHKHRLIRPQVLQQLAQRAGAECRLYFRTDFLPYYEASLAVLAESKDWQVVVEPWPFEFETVFQSRAPAHYSLVARRRA